MFRTVLKHGKVEYEHCTLFMIAILVFVWLLALKGVAWRAFCHPGSHYVIVLDSMARLRFLVRYTAAALLQIYDVD